jgi:hypothetical protein
MSRASQFFLAHPTPEDSWESATSSLVMKQGSFKDTPLTGVNIGVLSISWKGVAKHWF